MSVTKKAAIFLVLTFAVSWTALIASWLGGQRDVAGGGVASLIYVFSPAIMAILCSVLFEKGQRLKALGLRFRPNMWWLWALLIAFALTAGSAVITATFSPHKFVGLEDVARQLASLQHETYSDAKAYLLKTAGLMGLQLIQFIVLFTITEEFGWRGYLYHLWRPFGFWRTSFATGLVWGVWHWPMVYLFGLNYPEHRVLGLGLMVIFATLLAPIMTLVRERGHSVWAVGILHGAVNTVLVLVMVVLNAPQFPWDAAGIGTMGALAIGTLLIALLQRRTPAIAGRPFT